MKKQKIINIGILVIMSFAIVSCNTKNAALHIEADQVNAKVIIDGKEVGKVPLDIMVSEGNHLIEVYKENYDGRFYDLKKIELAENESKSVNFHLRLNAGSFVDERDDCVYETIKIGDQIWMAENLTYLPSFNDVNDGSKTEAMYYVNGFPSNRINLAKQTSNYKTYGVLYNWAAAKQSCPAGWHLPSDFEWKKLETTLGMSYTEVYEFNRRGTNEGSKLAGNADLWGNGSLKKSSKFDESGFTALPGGCRYGSGSFQNVGTNGYWWSATEAGINSAFFRNLNSYISDVGINVSLKSFGYSVRCVKD